MEKFKLKIKIDKVCASAHQNGLFSEQEKSNGKIQSNQCVDAVDSI